MSPFETNIPARLDRLPWSRFHWNLVIALGITWVLDGLEVTFIGVISSVLQKPETLALSPAQIGLLTSFYLAGAVLGALVFGYLADIWGRKRLFYITLFLYSAGVILSVFSWNLWSFCLFRFITGAGIGGEYSAINSAIDELIPARVRGRTNLIINGSYWFGSALASLSTLILLNPKYFSPDIGWRAGFAIGGTLGLVIIFFRRFIPESPRWLMVRGQRHDAEGIVSDIEDQIEEQQQIQLKSVHKKIRVKPDPHIGLYKVIKTLVVHYRRQSLVAFALITSQAFMYNAIFFTYALVLTKFYQVPDDGTGLYLLPFAVGNFLGPLILGHFFDVWGRRFMIGATYAISALILVLTGYLFAHGQLTAMTQTILWSVIFFFGSAAASSAYLTVSEIFPLETRGFAIAIFYAAGTGIGGVLAPWIFGALIGSGSPWPIFYGYMFAAGLMFMTSVIELRYGVDAEQKPLEEIAKPLSVT